MTPWHFCNITTYLRWPVCTVLLFGSLNVNAAEKNGFELNGALIPPGQVFKGGPDRDGIPALDKPEFVRSRNADYLKANDAVLGIVIDDIAKAYPVKILNWHEVVNDSINDQFFVVTFCPLCGSGVAFNSYVDGKPLSFGVSGLLYNSDVLLYDRETESLWSQLLNQAVTGQHKGRKLTMLPLKHTTWSDWKRHHPSTWVLSNDTGYWRDYDKDAYQGYDTSRQLYFPVLNRSPEKYHPKEKVLGLNVGDTYKAYPFIELNKFGKDHFTDTVNGDPYHIHWDKSSQSGQITNEAGIVIPIVQSYWFAWYAFHTNTLVFKAESQNSSQ